MNIYTRELSWEKYKFYNNMKFYESRNELGTHTEASPHLREYALSTFLPSLLL